MWYNMKSCSPSVVHCLSTLLHPHILDVDCWKARTSKNTQSCYSVSSSPSSHLQSWYDSESPHRVSPVSMSLGADCHIPRLPQSSCILGHSSACYISNCVHPAGQHPEAASSPNAVGGACSWTHCIDLSCTYHLLFSDKSWNPVYLHEISDLNLCFS